MTPPQLEAQSLHKTYSRTVALDRASARVEAGEIVAVTGPSGSGKSTLMLCLAGVLVPDAGQVLLDGQRLDELSERERAIIRRRDFGLVLQFGQLLPELTVADNVAVPLLLAGRTRMDAGRSASIWLERMGAAELATAWPGELSSGQQQRVAIARALVTGPRVIFADEPTGALDSVSAAAVMGTLVTVARETDATLVVITHDNLVAAHADREIVVRNGREDPHQARR